MRKYICLCLALMLCLCLCACKSSDYKKAMSLFETGEYEEAIAAFEALGEYKDSVQKIDECKYEAAVDLMESGSFEEAIAAFKALGEYSDSVQKINECKYRAAVALMDSGNYEEAIAAFEAIGEYKDCAQKIRDCKTAILDIRYDEAIALMDTDVVLAYEALAALCGHKDSNAMAASLYDDYLTAKIPTLKDGDTIYFGSYEQDNKKSNGQEPIEWIVIEDSGNTILLISKYGLDCRRFNYRDNWHWGQSDLRDWMKEDFFNAAFSPTEQKLMGAWEEGLDPGYKERINYVTLLKEKQVETLLSDDEAICPPTAYARERGTIIDGGWWWLQSSKIGDAQYAMTVMNGRITGADKNADMIAVRPVIKIYK